MSADLLDPDQFPFTEAELRSAMELARNRAPEFAALADDFVEGIRNEYHDRLRVDAARARGSKDLDEIAYSYFIFPEEVFALLAEVSTELKRRVRAWREHD